MSKPRLNRTFARLSKIPVALVNHTNSTRKYPQQERKSTHYPKKRRARKETTANH